MSPVCSTGDGTQWLVLGFGSWRSIKREYASVFWLLLGNKKPPQIQWYKATALSLCSPILPVGNNGEGLSWLLDVQVLSWKTGMLRWESSDSWAHTIQRLAYSHIWPLAEETGGPGLPTRGPEGGLSM